MKFIKFQCSQYFSDDNQWMIAKNSCRTWDVYRSFQPFKGEYKFTCKTLKEAKEKIKTLDK